MAVRIRQAGIRSIRDNEVVDFVTKLGRRIAVRASRLSPNFSGRLSRSIRAGRTVQRGNLVSVKIGTNTGYGLFPETGTGIFGPTGRPIRPKNGTFLVFQPRGLGHVIRVRSVRGQPGQHYMRQALLSEIRNLGK